MIIALITVSLCGLLGMEVSAQNPDSFVEHPTTKNCSLLFFWDCRPATIKLSTANSLNSHCSNYINAKMYEATSNLVTTNKGYKTKGKKIKIISCQQYIGDWTNYTSEYKPTKVKVLVCSNSDYSYLGYLACNSRSEPIDNFPLSYLKYIERQKPINKSVFEKVNNVSTKSTPPQKYTTGIAATLVKVKLSSGSYSNNCYQRLNSTRIGQQSYWVVRDRGDLSVTAGRKAVPNNSDLIYVPLADIRLVKSSDCKAEIIYQK